MMGQEQREQATTVVGRTSKLLPQSPLLTAPEPLKQCHQVEITLSKHEPVGAISDQTTPVHTEIPLKVALKKRGFPVA